MIKQQKKTILTALLAFAFGLGLTLIASTESMAVHKGTSLGSLACGACHTMHNSQGDAGLGGNSGGSLVLLRGSVTTRANMQNFCFSCHASNGSQKSTGFNGTSNTAPKVYIDAADRVGSTPGSGTYAVAASDPFDFTKLGAGGDFSAVGTFTAGTFTLTAGKDDVVGLGYGHSIGLASATPPGANSGGGAAVAIPNFTCTSCHDPHGRYSTSGNNINLFRNLKYNITWESDAMTNPMTGMFTYAGGNTLTTAFAGDNPTAITHIWPVITNAAGTQNRYNAGAGTGSQTAGTEFNNWCGQCHGKWHESLVTANKSGDDWLRHPVANSLTDSTPNSGAGVSIVDFAHYNQSGANSYAPYTTTVGTRLPAMQNLSTGLTYYADDSSDQVFCLTCHYAHGGPNLDGLRWSHNSAVSTGAQTGNALASNVGCQQCHNR